MPDFTIILFADSTVCCLTTPAT